MAIYHCSLKVFSRSKGHSAVAAAAYRSGSQLYDERSQKIHRYDKRSGVAETFILLPENTSSEFQSRAFLWNAVEASERRKNSCVARELILALPHELSDKERGRLTRDMALYLMERYRVAVDSAIHAPVEGDGHDSRNYHAHILFSTRELTSTGFGKKTRILDDKVTGKEETELIREVWETLANDALKRAGHSDVQIDRRSLEEQGIDRIPQTHIGPKAKAADIEPSSKDDRDDEDEDSGKEDSSEGKGAGGSGDSMPLKLSEEVIIERAEEPKKDKLDKSALASKGEYEYGKNEPLNRAEFVKEIKRINQERASYGEKPLDQQIAELDRLMEKLDVKVQHLETLKERSSLTSVLKKSIDKLIKFSGEVLHLREQGAEQSKLSSEEKARKSERQLSRYGRSYRAGLHEQIKEMKDNISTLKAKQQEYTGYKSFVESIEKQIDQQPNRAFEKVKGESKTKHISNEESSIKLALKAAVIRENLPIDSKQSREAAPQKLDNALNRKDEPKPIKTPIETTNIETKISIENNKLKALSESKISIKIGAEAKAVSEKSRSVFNAKAQPDPKVKNDPNPPYKQTIKNFDPIKTHTEQQAKSERKNWFTPATEKTKPMMETIAKKMAEMRKEQPAPKEQKRHDPNTMKGQFNTRTSEKFTTNEAHRAKTRAEAEAKRAQVPPEYRAKPYEQETPKQQPKQREDFTSKMKSSYAKAEGTIKKKWEEFRGEAKSSPEPEAREEKPRAKMSSGFNKASFDDVKTDKADPIITHEDIEPEV